MVERAADAAAIIPRITPYLAAYNPAAHATNPTAGIVAAAAIIIGPNKQPAKIVPPTIKTLDNIINDVALLAYRSGFSKMLSVLYFKGWLSIPYFYPYYVQDVSIK